MIGSRNLWGGNAPGQSGHQSRLVVLQVGGSSSITWGMSFKMAVLMILTASTGHSLSHRQLGEDASRLLHQSPFTIHIQTAAAIGTLIEQGLMSWKPREGIARLAPSDSVVHPLTWSRKTSRTNFRWTSCCHCRSCWRRHSSSASGTTACTQVQWESHGASHSWFAPWKLLDAPPNQSSNQCWGQSVPPSYPSSRQCRKYVYRRGFSGSCSSCVT